MAAMQLISSPLLPLTSEVGLAVQTGIRWGHEAAALPGITQLSNGHRVHAAHPCCEFLHSYPAKQTLRAGQQAEGQMIPEVPRCHVFTGDLANRGTAAGPCAKPPALARGDDDGKLAPTVQPTAATFLSERTDCSKISPAVRAEKGARAPVAGRHLSH